MLLNVSNELLVSLIAVSSRFVEKKKKKKIITLRVCVHAGFVCLELNDCINRTAGWSWSKKRPRVSKVARRRVNDGRWVLVANSTR
jgi:hypothetical protein